MEGVGDEGSTKRHTLVPVDVGAELNLVTVLQLGGCLGCKPLAVQDGAVHGTLITEVDFRDAVGGIGRQEGVLARDDRTVDVRIVRCRHQLFLGNIAGGTANGEGRVQRQVELAGLIRVVPLHVPKDDAERWEVSESGVEHGERMEGMLTGSHDIYGIACALIVAVRGSWLSTARVRVGGRQLGGARLGGGSLVVP